MKIVWPVTVGIVFLLSGILSYGLSRYSGRWAIFDNPNQRSLHGTPVPRLGGIAILVGILTAGTMMFRWNETGSWSLVMPILLASMLVILISLADDIFQIPIPVRLVCHLIAGALVVAGGLALHVFYLVSWALSIPAMVGAGLSILFVTWMINLYNFMDGLDGLAAGMGIIGFCTFALLGHLAGVPEFTRISLGVAAACGGFLLLNFPPAKLFMGDMGSASLGFLAAVFTLWADHSGIFPFWIGVVVFSPFIVDASWTLIRRVVKGSKPWEAHREHFYQRLVLGVGWGRYKTLLWEYGLMMICSLTALGMEWSNRPAVEWAALGSLILLYGVLIAWINFQEARRNTKHITQ
ncbi:MAG: glycosyltransferase family 4 protein [Gammaproteobacteria bacterium]